MRHILTVSILVFILLNMTSTVVEATQPRDPYKYFFNETWGNFQEELENARAAGKKGVLVFFEQDECPFCHYMKKNVLNQIEVQEYFRKYFLNFAVDIEGDINMKNFMGKTMKQKDFAFRENRVRATPVFVFFDLTGKRIHRYTGKTSGVKEFLWLGEYVVSKTYKKMSFSRYKHNKRKNNK